MGHGEVAHLSDTAGGIPHAVAFASVVAQDVPRFHVRQCVFDAGTNPLMDGVEVAFPTRAADCRWPIYGRA